ncbi:MAG: DUF2931 family protein [Rhodobacteraceae bacterium]|nr:DUF2931 family protein [Paracoccaceae bacterium]
MDKRFKAVLAVGLFVTTALILITSILIAFEDSNDMTEVYWTPAISAHEAYPAELLLGSFEDANGNKIDLRAGKPINSGWGSATGLADIGPAVKALPIYLDLQYFSYAEDKFYGRKLDLSTVELTKLFEAGFANQRSGKQGQYDTLIVGLGAGGNVSLWVAGDRHVHQVSTFEVPQIDVAWEDFRPSSLHTRPDFIKMVMSDLDYSGNAQDSPDRFAKFKRQYPWAVEIVSDGPVGELRLNYLNGERDFFNFMRPFTFRSTLGAPLNARLTWSGTDGGKYVANITFDIAETLAAYETLADGGAGKLRLELRIADTNRSVLVALRDDQRFYEFEQASIQVFRRKN